MFTNIQTNWISLKQETFNLGTMEIPKKKNKFYVEYFPCKFPNMCDMFNLQ